ncbi:MAG TPA: tRNA (adenosine(37)-N6)-threonylcarbamoyltransferase complex transferase subunit TsaD [Bacteroidetes bacterium]|nr:tRNA N6-adenosine threonylcarbamoyltransferase [bacterium BMS3Bbin04]HDO64766.1 tRNA (adenosine(37)-N6)-threonylcarbamoyltransferase complex transferase subunit TsaD [Bacteroidota bacterium]HEX03891.1 tRNA (adenosine(37)-N6)-threonylcarbamoyltransferase complex transferase subunit TsaD [Bacteroidota bacterium]
MAVTVLAVESSCDETAVAVISGNKLLASLVSTQEVHSLWGGVVPELASRLHQRTLTSLAHEAIARAGIQLTDLDAVAATVGPGLIGALLVGASYGKGLAVGLGKQFVGVNHLEGHLWSAAVAAEELPLPALALLVSGGHTELIRINGFGEYALLGATLDDAAGEAFDKVGGLLGITYPAGEELSKLASRGNDRAFHFAVARTQTPLDFSYSGLKSAASREVEKQKQSGNDNWAADLAASFQRAVVRQLIQRVDTALTADDYKSLTLGGGVAANQLLRSELEKSAMKHNVSLRVPPLQYCTDNAAMIAWVAARKIECNQLDPLTNPANPNLSLVPEIV